MSRYILLLFFLAAVFATVTESLIPPFRVKECRENEEYTTCGTACEPSCLDPNPQNCIKQCVLDCQCKEGFVRDRSGVCIEPCRC